jgi:hypothetical protein
MEGEEHRLAGAVERGVVRIGNTVRRPLRGNAAFTHALLRHLEQAGFDGAPRMLGFDSQGREILSFIEGTSGPPVAHGRRIDDVLIVESARLLRRYHDITAGSTLANGAEIVCHGDWNPTNTVFRGQRAVALIDFEASAPGTRLWDLGYGAYQWLDLGWPQFSAKEQRRRLDLLVSAYGLRSIDARAVADAAVARLGVFAEELADMGQSENAGWARKCADWTAAAFGVPTLARRRPAR